MHSYTGSTYSDVEIMQIPIARRSLLVAGLFLVGGVVCGEANRMSAAQQQISNLALALSRDEIQKIEILQIPAGVATRAQITPEMLEKQYQYKLTISEVLRLPGRQKLIEVLKSLSVQPRGDTADLRWGVILYSRTDVRLGAVYLDRTGRFGAVDNSPVSFSGELFQWLESAFSRCFQ